MTEDRGWRTESCLIKLLAIRLGCQTTPAKSLVMLRREYLIIKLWRSHTIFCLLSSFICLLMSDRHQVGFFNRQSLVDLGDEAIGQFLDLVLRATLLVFRDLFAFERVFERVIGVTANVAHRHL